MFYRQINPSLFHQTSHFQEGEKKHLARH